MNRHRVIAAAPVRSAAEAWQTVVTLIADTIERSPSIKPESVSQELSVLAGIGPALIGGGHLESNALVLADGRLHLSINVLTGQRALAVQENLHPVPGGTSATANWKVYVPADGPYGSAIASAVSKSEHVTVDPAPSTARTNEGTHEASAIDLDALRSSGVNK